MKKIILLSIVIILLLPVCTKQIKQTKDVYKMNIYSNVFKNNQMIPSKYTCKGENISPPLNWDSIPENTKSLVLIVDDPDAPMGTWIHWVLYNIPPTLNNLSENIEQNKTYIDSGMIQGINSGKYIGYQGPCPPSGTHRYFFKIYALDIAIEPVEKMTKSQILKAMENHIIAHGELIGLYSK